MSFFDKLFNRYPEEELPVLLDCWGFGRLEIENPYATLQKVVQAIVLRGKKVSCAVIAKIINHDDLYDHQRAELINLLYPLCYDKHNTRYLVLSFDRYGMSTDQAYNALMQVLNGAQKTYPFNE